MARGTWVLTVTAPLVLGAFAGCAGMGPAKIDDNTVARLPAAEKANLVTRDQRVVAAESNVNSAKVALREAKQFRQMSHHEVRSAEAQFEAAQKAVTIGRESQSQRTLVAGNRANEGARAELLAAQSKREFANRLIDLREAQVDEAEAALKLARADNEWAKVEALDRNNMSQNVDKQRFVASHQKAETDLAAARQKVARLNGDAEQAHASWAEHRGNVASAGGVALPPPPAPPQRVAIPPSDVAVPESAPKSDAQK